MKIAKLFMVFLILLLAGCSSTGSTETGLIGGNLRPCPDSPNCVSSQSKKDSHYADPIPYNSLSFEQARQLMLDILASEKGCTVVTSKERYIHAEYRSRIFRFVDDVEFLFPEDQNVIHIRSASRVGYSDMGVNAKRVEHIRDVFNQKSRLE